MDQLNSASEPLDRTIIIYNVHRNVCTKAFKIINLLVCWDTGGNSILAYQFTVNLFRCGNAHLTLVKNQGEKSPAQNLHHFHKLSTRKIKKTSNERELFTLNYGPLAKKMAWKILMNFFFTRNENGNDVGKINVENIFTLSLE